jgi:flagellar biosynthetic protein FlhB
MADSERDDRTEAPTDRRRQETREQGNIARSTDLNVALLSMAATGVLNFFGGEITQSLLTVLRTSLAADPWLQINERTVIAYGWQMANVVANGLVPMGGILVLAAISAGALQAGFHLTPSALQPNWSRLNPLSGAQRLFSLQGAMRVTASLLKVTILGAVVYSFLASQLPQLMASTSVELAPLANLTGTSLLTLSFQLSLALVLLAGLDYGYQFWQFEQNLKMTKQEMRDEMRMMEGDPQLRFRRKELHKKLTESRQVQATKSATVVITNPTELAIALKYDPKKMNAPVIVAKGADLIAARIRQIAAENSVPIVEKKPLARALFQIKVGHPVPVELYAAVAEIIAYVMRLSGRKAG